MKRPRAEAGGQKYRKVIAAVKRAKTVAWKMFHFANPKSSQQGRPEAHDMWPSITHMQAT